MCTSHGSLIYVEATAELLPSTIPLSSVKITEPIAIKP